MSQVMCACFAPVHGPLGERDRAQGRGRMRWEIAEGREGEQKRERRSVYGNGGGDHLPGLAGHMCSCLCVCVQKSDQSLTFIIMSVCFCSCCTIYQSSPCPFFFCVCVAALQRHPLSSVSILQFSGSIFIVTVVLFYFWKGVAYDTVFFVRMS